MRTIIAFLLATITLGCGQKVNSSENIINNEPSLKLSLNLDVMGDDMAIMRHQDNPQSGFCDYYLDKKIQTASDRNSLGFCHVRLGNMIKGEMSIWQAAEEGDPMAIANKEKMINEYQKLGIQSFSKQYTGLSVEELLGGKAPVKPPVSDGGFAWRLTASGATPYGNISIYQANNSQGSYTVKVWFLDENNTSRSYVTRIVDVSHGMNTRISLAGDTSFTYPSEGWSYILEINELMTGRKIYSETGPLPIDYDGSIIGY